jgi:hypothetical protein
MSKVIQVLAEMANNTECQSDAAIEALVTAANLNATTAEAILAKDVTSLERQLDVRTDIYCAVFPADDEDDKEDKDKDDTDSSEKISNIAIGF